MKRNTFYLSWLLLTLACAAPAAEKLGAAPPLVPAELKKAALISSTKANTGAKIYYLFSASRSDSACVEYGAAIAKLYNEMRGKGAELILLSKDSPADALKWAKSVGLKCPILPANKRSAKLPFPYTGLHIPPYLVALDAQGLKLAESNGESILALLRDWRSLLADYEREQKRKHQRWADDDTLSVDDLDAPEEEEDMEDDEEDVDDEEDEA